MSACDPVFPVRQSFPVAVVRAVVLQGKSWLAGGRLWGHRLPFTLSVSCEPEHTVCAMAETDQSIRAQRGAREHLKSDCLVSRWGSWGLTFCPTYRSREPARGAGHWVPRICIARLLPVWKCAGGLECGQDCWWGAAGCPALGVGHSLAKCVETLKCFQLFASRVFL